MAADSCSASATATAGRAEREASLGVAAACEATTSVASEYGERKKKARKCEVKRYAATMRRYFHCTFQARCLHSQTSGFERLLQKP